MCSWGINAIVSFVLPHNTAVHTNKFIILLQSKSTWSQNKKPVYKKIHKLYYGQDTLHQLLEMSLLTHGTWKILHCCYIYVTFLYQNCVVHHCISCKKIQYNWDTFLSWKKCKERNLQVARFVALGAWLLYFLRWAFLFFKI